MIRLGKTIGKLWRQFVLTPMLALAIPSSGAAADKADPVVYAIHAGHLIVDASRPMAGPSTVIVSDGRIVRIEDGFTSGPPGATIVDLSTKTVLPGLIDSHVHLANASANGPFAKTATTYHAVTYGLHNAALTVRAGFTTVRSVGEPTLAGLAVRDAVAAGLFPGPRILTSGHEFSAVGGAGDETVGWNPEIAEPFDETHFQGTLCVGADGCTQAVRVAAKLGVNVIKVYATGAVLDNVTTGLEQQLSDPELKAIVETAHSLGLRVAAHAHGARGIEAAVRAGADSIEHGTFADDRDIALMKAHGTYLVPTLRAVAELDTMLRNKSLSPDMEVKARAAVARWGQTLRAAFKAGVPIALGTDAGVFPHGRNAEELGLMVRLGQMTPRDALIAATKGSADLLGLADQVGTLDAGKSADLIAVDGDPLTDPETLLKVRYVMARGVPISLQ